jgi:GH35 family endo-1,4-beta-xylanase
MTKRKDFSVKSSLKSINAENYILSVLSPEDRLDAAFKLAKEAFKNAKLTMADIDNAVRAIRKKAYGKKS